MTIAKPKVTAVRYERIGSVLAIAPKAFFETFFMYDEPSRENTEAGEAVIVDIRDPLEQRSHYCYDSYEDVLARVHAACATAARAVILRFDSPGGEAAGCFEAAREMRAICDAAGKPVHAYIEGDCCSAAYAFAAACTSITIGETALCGSVGVVMCREDFSAQNTARGIRVAFITSGARKADGHPDQPITDAELASLQGVIDAMGQVFFAHVSATRGIAVDAIAQLEAKIFDGQAAVAAGLADEVGSLASVLARIASGVTTTTKGPTMAMTYEEARAALEEVAGGDDANAKAAKAALAAMDAAAGGAPDGDGDKPPTDPDPDAADPAPGVDDPKKKDDDQKAAAAAYREAIAARSEVAKMRAELKLERESAERRELLASRPGLDAAMTALLQKAPIELVRETISAMPASPINPEPGRAPLRGLAQTASGQAPDEKAKLDARMGLVPTNPQNMSTETKLVLSARRASTPPVVPPTPGTPGTPPVN